MKAIAVLSLSFLLAACAQAPAAKDSARLPSSDEQEAPELRPFNPPIKISGDQARTLFELVIDPDEANLTVGEFQGACLYAVRGKEQKVLFFEAPDGTINQGKLLTDMCKLAQANYPAEEAPDFDDEDDWKGMAAPLNYRCEKSEVKAQAQYSCELLQDVR